MVSATGNNVRDDRLYAAMRSLDVVTFDATVAALPEDFDLDQTEFRGAVKILARPDVPGEFTPAIPLRDESDFVHTQRHVPLAQVEPEPEPTKPVLTRDEASAAVLKTNNALGEARLTLRRAQQTTRDARAALANSITVWQQGAPLWTDAMERAAMARAYRDGKGQGQKPAPRIANSQIDREAAYGRDDSASGAVRSRFQRGGSHRGAFSRAAMGSVNHDPARGPVGK